MKFNHRRSLLCFAAVLIVGPQPSSRALFAADVPPTGAATQSVDVDTTALANIPPVTLADQTTVKAMAYLRSQQKPDGSWQNEMDPPGVTALVLRAMLAGAPNGADDPQVKKGFDKLLSYQLENGGIYKDALACYNTAIAITALAAADRPQYHDPMEKALAYLRSLQWSDKIEGVPEGLRVKDSDPRYGGFGYGKRARPDLSNTQMALDALHDAGVKSTDPAYAAAVKFATRCQNLSETNDQSWASDDGGFVYTPALGGNSPAGEYKDASGRRLLRSYGSMTYAGLKSMIYAGLSHDDPRVKAAFAWISLNYTLDQNPGMGATGPANAQGGLYYYYHTLSRALSAYGVPTIIDAQHKSHNWRIELIQQIAARQRPDGSFVGESRWMESNPVLVTSYCVIALHEAEADLKNHPMINPDLDVMPNN